MQFNIVVKSKSAVETVKKGKNSYETFELYYDKDGKEEKRKFVSFNHPDVFSTAASLNAGDVALATVEKEGEYWQWTGLTKGGSSMAAEAPARKAAGTYETAEERAKRQVYIVRQSSLANAIEYLKLSGAENVTTEDVLGVAEKFVDFVFGELE